MNFFMRAIWSLWGNKRRSLILLITLFVLGNLILAGLSIQAATKQSSEWAKEKLGTNVTLKYDYVKAVQSAGMNDAIPYELIPMEEIELLGSIDYVTEYHFFDTIEYVASNFEPVETESDLDQYDYQRAENIGVQFVNKTQLSPEFYNGTNVLLEGRHLSEDDIGKNLALIENTIANENDINIGDSIELANKFLDDLSLEVVGIYETSVVLDSSVTYVQHRLPWNQVYTPFTEPLTNDSLMVEAVFYFDSVSNMAPFIEKAKQTSSLDFDHFSLMTSTDYYEEMAGPLEMVSDLSNTMVNIVLLSSFVILILLMMLFVKGRIHEIGVLISLGESKRKILGQLWVEVAFLVAIAFALSSISGSLIGEYVGTHLLEQEVSLVREPVGTEEDFLRTLGIGGAEHIEIISDIDISISGSVLLLLGGIGVLLSIISTTIPAFFVLRLNPRDIIIKND
ncbi:ABC transporter permease [Evansella cellulosilytica]|uniref:ABC3 transporter permease C-terminal domain-containing protein n=1 Tax=Evansella cellulosilytica (strain ATCC 21833 / DSM 2522 / FERM P-1141 / JCM 9156 / N-4) TaxID=649639 RepID=E6TVJ6_EVAC2|nr:ABC transporter permease [Evansella cellulosilytica]ADU31013.1 protein of unknown function DUF214 [Evansella cellulosilytica DSM 2522]